MPLFFATYLKEDQNGELACMGRHLTPLGDSFLRQEDGDEAASLSETLGTIRGWVDAMNACLIHRFLVGLHASRVKCLSR